MGFRSLLADERTPQEYLTEVRTGGTNRRWPAAYELSRLMADPSVAANRDARPRRWSRRSTRRRTTIRACGGIWRSRSAGSTRRCRPRRSPRSLESRAERSRTARARISAIWALGSSGDPPSCPSSSRCTRPTMPASARWSVYALGALPGDAQIATLRDGAATTRRPTSAGMPPSRWRVTEREGVPVLRQMLDRAYVERTVTRRRRGTIGRRSGRRRDDQRSAGGRGAEGCHPADVGRSVEPAGSRREGAAGRARSVEGDG